MPVCVVGISGGSCSGKTTLARMLAECLGQQCVLLSQDWYYRDLATMPLEERAQANFDAPDAIETRLLAVHLSTLAKGRAVEAPQYDFTKHTRRAETFSLAPAPVLVVEGLHVIGMPELSRLLTLRVYLETSDAARLARRLARDTRERGRRPAQVLAQFEATVRPMHARFVAPLRALADVVVDGDRPLEAAVADLAERIERQLRTGR